MVWGTVTVVAWGRVRNIRHTGCFALCVQIERIGDTFHYNCDIFCHSGRSAAIGVIGGGICVAEYP